MGDPYLGGDPIYQLHLITNVGGTEALIRNALGNLIGIFVGEVSLTLSWTVHHEIVQGLREYIDYAEECYDDCTGKLISREELGPFATGRTGEVTLEEWDEPVEIGIK